jgi:hypothetical protein
VLRIECIINRRIRLEELDLFLKAASDTVTVAPRNEGMSPAITTGPGNHHGRHQSPRACPPGARWLRERPAAPLRATARALAKVDNAVAAVLVEGISDQIAPDTAAVGRGRDLEAERVVIVPIGGAHAIGRLLTRLSPLRTRVRLAGLCDLRVGRKRQILATPRAGC